MRDHIVLMVLVPRTMDVHTSRQGVIPSDTLCIETRSDVNRLDSLMQNDTLTLVGISNPILVTQVKDGDIRLRWTFLAPASEDTARSAGANFSDVATAHYLVSR
jgi:hypothetical protein